MQVQHCASSTGLKALMTRAKTDVYPIVRILTLIQIINLPYLVERVSRLKDDGWEEQKEEHIGPKHFLLL